MSVSPTNKVSQPSAPAVGNATADIGLLVMELLEPKREVGGNSSIYASPDIQGNNHGHSSIKVSPNIEGNFTPKLDPMTKLPIQPVPNGGINVSPNINGNTLDFGGIDVSPNIKGNF